MTDIHYEMLWDCENCGTRGLLGVSHRHCPGCGAAQDPSRRYFPEPGQEVEAKDHVYSGIDWRCAYCETPNSAAAKFCVNCSAGQDGSKPVALKTDEPEPPEETYPPVPATTITPVAPAPAPKEPLPPAKASSGGLAWLFGILFVVVAGLATGVSMFFSKAETTVTVVEQAWERRIAIERFSPAKDDAWCDSLPGGAYNITRSSEVRSHRQVADGETCTEKRVDKGDGSFTKQKECSPRYRDEPVYADRCRFTINRWQVDRQATATQLDGALPAWPVARFTPGSTSLDMLGAEREGARSETYRIVIGAGDKQWTCDLPLARWEAFPRGKRATVAVRKLGGADCDSLR